MSELFTKRGVSVPAELAAAIKSDPTVLAQWNRARPSRQTRYADHVSEARRPETRARRVAAMLEQMAETYGKETV